MWTRYDPVSPELVARWKAQQEEMRRRVRVEGLGELPRFVAGADVALSADRESVLAAAVVYDRELQQVIEIVHARGKLDIPYVPGFLSFREGPVLLEAIGQLKHEWGVLCCDGQGYAHPRRCGLATHVGLMLDRPAVGVAKSRLVGRFVEPGPQKGNSSPLLDHGEQIGLVLRTKDRVNPVFISVGHRIDLDSAVKVVLACTTRYRIPEPTRQADIEVGKEKLR